MLKAKTKTAKKTAPKRTPFVPATATVDHGHEYPMIPVTPPFLLAYNPRRWGVMLGQVVPLLHTVPLKDGVNGVTKGPSGWRLAKLRDRMERLGRTLIPYSEGPDGSYIDEVETRTPAGDVVPTYVSAFAETFAGSSEVRADSAAYVAWIQDLMKRGVLPAPPPYVVESLLHERSADLIRAKDAHTKSKSASDQEAVKALEGIVKQLKALAKPRTPATTKPAAIPVAD